MDMNSQTENMTEQAGESFSYDAGSLSIIIPAFNEEKYLGPTLQSVVQNAPDNLLEIIVVNNASSDHTADVAKSFTKVRVINEQHKGLTRARQAGLLASRGQLIAYIDADTRVSKKWFETLFKEFSANSKLICLSGPYKYYDLEAPEKWVVTTWNFFAQLVSFRGYVIMGGNFTAKKQAFFSAGGFDPSIEFFGEDTDIARRLHRIGEVKFSKQFLIGTSARRFKKEGLIKTGFKYLINFCSVVFLKKPVSVKYTDIR